MAHRAANDATNGAANAGGRAWPEGSGEMAGRIRALDWAGTPLGAPEGWPDRLRGAVELLLPCGVPMGVLWGPDLVLIYNDGYRDLMGSRHPRGLGRPAREGWPGSWADEEPILARVRQGESVTRERAAWGPGERRLALSFSPLRDAAADGGAVGGVLVILARDPDPAPAGAAAAERLRELRRELQHRTRNLLAVVRAVADRTLAQSASLEAFAGRFRDRLDALARANGLLSRLGEGTGVDFAELAGTEMAAQGLAGTAGSDGPGRLSGPEGLRLPPPAVQILSLALHELATDAVRRGALSRRGARIDLRWGPVPGAEGEPPRLRVDWAESGLEPPMPDAGPLPDDPAREMVTAALPYQTGAEVEWETHPDGIRCRLVLPLARGSVP